MLKRFLYIILVSPVFLGTIANAESMEFSIDEQNKNLLYFNGDITQAAAVAFKEYLKRGIDTVVVNSVGGDGVAGLMIAKEFRKKNITLIVDKYCFSSCANYLFVGAKKKSLRPDAVLGFHGGLTGSGLPTLPSADFPLLSKRERAIFQKQMYGFYHDESAFFHGIGFDPGLFKTSSDLTKLAVASQTIQVTVEGKVSEFTFEQKAQAEELIARLKSEHKSYSYNATSSMASPTKMYFPSRETLIRHGVTNIEEYDYPANIDKLKTIETKLSELKSRGLELVGDF